MRSVCVVFALLASIALATGEPNLWPLPQDYVNGDVEISVQPSPGFFYMANGWSDLLYTAFQRYNKITFPHAYDMSQSGTIVGMSVLVDDYDESHPQLDTDESYTLDVSDGGSIAYLHAKTVYGALRGLETFSQLVTFSFDSESYRVKNGPWKITDSPRFAHRGLMIDSARHFETLESIKHIISSLPYAKLNVLHWHMVDTQSFPFQSKLYPKLWDGAYSDYEKFTQEDIAGVVEFARLHGVRVMVEFDVPGHAASWCAGYPEICPSSSCQQPLNVANDMTFDVIGGLVKECSGGKTSEKGAPSGLFPDDFIHLGGDEVDTSCWGKTASVAEWLSDHNMTEDDGYAYFVDKAAKIAIANGRRPVQWSEVYDHFKTELNTETIVHIWKSNTNVTEVLANGYQVLLNVGNNANSWYLDHLGTNWEAVYGNEPCKGVPDDLCHLIIGGHGEMWGETVDTSDLQQTVWPRLASIGERLWSPRNTDGSTALGRIEYFRCLLNRRGIEAAPVTNPNARSAPTGPGSCFDQ